MSKSTSNSPRLRHRIVAVAALAVSSVAGATPSTAAGADQISFQGFCAITADAGGAPDSLAVQSVSVSYCHGRLFEGTALLADGHLGIQLDIRAVGGLVCVENPGVGGNSVGAFVGTKATLRFVSGVPFPITMSLQLSAQPQQEDIDSRETALVVRGGSSDRYPLGTQARGYWRFGVDDSGACRDVDMYFVTGPSVSSLAVDNVLSSL